MSNRLMAVLQTRDDFCKEFLGLDLYPYQRKYISDPMIESVLGGLGRRIYAEFPRQSGKTSAAAATALFMATSWREISGAPLRIGWFAPTVQTTNIWFQSVKNFLTTAQLKGLGIEVGVNNSTTLELEGSTIRARTAGEGTNTKGETFHLIGTDETADILDEKLEYDIKYMGAATNATYLHVGTPSYKMANRRFFEAVQRGGPHVYILPFQEACESNLLYAKYVASQDQESDDFKMMIGMQWILEKSFFVTPEKLYACRNEQPRVFDCTEEACYAAIDWAKEIDSTVVTVFRRKAGGVEILNWLELQNTDYSDQIGIINEFLGHYKNMHMVVCDSTGTQDQIVDMLRNATRYTVKGIKFTPQSKHDMFIAFQEAINRGWFEYPSEDCREVRRFEKQMIELVREYRGNYLACHAPEDSKSHDDYCFVAGTRVLTSEGQIPIEKIKVGDLVLTRNGFKPVERVGARVASVISRFGLTGTLDHPMITVEGTKKLINVDETDKLYIWNEKQSRIEIKPTTDIPIQNEGTSEYISGVTTNGKNRQNLYIDKFGRTTTAQFQMGTSSTILMKIPLTTQLKTYEPCRADSTNVIMRQLQNVEILPEKTCSNTRFRPQPRQTVPLQEHMRVEPTTKKGDMLLFLGKNENSNVKSVDILRPRSSLVKSNIVLSNAKPNETTVYNISVSECPEYFANNILVHNCVAAAMGVWTMLKHQPIPTFGGLG